MAADHQVVHSHREVTLEGVLDAHGPELRRLVKTRAAYLTALGGPEQIRFGTLQVPAIGPTDVLVRVLAVEVNRVDTYVRSGNYQTPTPFPFIIGRDLVGEVAAHGT